MGAKTEKWLFRGLGAAIACLMVWGATSHVEYRTAYEEYRHEERCREALVDIKSFDVCYEQLPGCWFTYDNIKELGRTIDFKKRECTE